MSLRSIDHFGISVENLDRSITWWTRFLQTEPFQRGTWTASELEDYVGRVVGYPGCAMSAAFWALPGGSVLELIEYHNPPTGHVDMETYNVGNSHLCFETEDMNAEYERLRDLVEFRSAEPVQSVWGPYKGTLVCYLRDPDGISIELVQFPAKGRPFDEHSPFVNPYGR